MNIRIAITTTWVLELPIKLCRNLYNQQINNWHITKWKNQPQKYKNKNIVKKIGYNDIPIGYSSQKVCIMYT